MDAIAGVKSTGEAAPPHPLAPLVSSWRRHLSAVGKAHKTIVIYTSAADTFGRYLAEQGMPTKPTGIRREHVEAYIQRLRDRGLSASTVKQHTRSIKLFFAWLIEEGEVKADRDPTRNVKVPVPEVKPPEVLTVEELGRLMKACQRGRSPMENRRDEAIIRLFADTGIRLSELVGLMVDQVDLDSGVLRVTGKGSGRGPRQRLVWFGPKTAAALDKYLRLRAQHRLRELPELWLGRYVTQPLTVSGVAQLVRERGRLAGIERLHPHLFRHTYAHLSLAAGMQEGDLQRLGGWRDRSMLSRYGASAATERALAAQKKLGLGNKW
jgi:site-specific recombinase XerD